MGSKEINNRRYYRAEVHLSEGSQDYDLVGYTKEQIINDILDQYERHLQLLCFRFAGAVCGAGPLPQARKGLRLHGLS